MGAERSLIAPDWKAEPWCTAEVKRRFHVAAPRHPVQKRERNAGSRVWNQACILPYLGASGLADGKLANPPVKPHAPAKSVA